MRQGEKSPAVRAVQLDLKFMGYDLGKFGVNKDGVDSDYGNATRIAIEKFETDSKLPKSAGVLTQRTWFALMNAVIKKNGIENFTVEEFVCKCGRADCNGIPSLGISIPFLKKLQNVRRATGNNSITITQNGGYRCEPWNKARGGATKSQHWVSNPFWAADIQSSVMGPRQLEVICDKEFANHGVGMGGATIVHVDLRAGRTRWKYA